MGSFCLLKLVISYIALNLWYISQKQILRFLRVYNSKKKYCFPLVSIHYIFPKKRQCLTLLFVSSKPDAIKSISWRWNMIGNSQYGMKWKQSRPWYWGLFDWVEDVFMIRRNWKWKIEREIGNVKASHLYIF